MLRHKWKIAFGLVAAIIVYFGYGILLLSGATRSFEPQLVDTCHRVDIAPGAEDIQYDPDTGLVFITADNRRATGHEDHGDGFGTIEANGIYALDVTPDRLEDIGNPIKVSPADLTDFRPHGLYLWSDGAGTKRLFVVSHPTTGEEIVEIFDVGEGGMLTHAESVSFPEMYAPNDVVAVGPRQFYATNFLRYKHGNMALIEVLLSLPLTSVAYFDGESGRTVAGGLAFANGINLSPDQKTLYVAEWTKQRIPGLDRAAVNRSAAKEVNWSADGGRQSRYRQGRKHLGRWPAQNVRFCRQYRRPRLDPSDGRHQSRSRNRSA